MEDQERQLATFQRIDALRNEAFYQNFAGIPLHGWGQSGPTFYAYLPKANRYFIDSNYYYRNKLEFFHLTSINNLWSILRSQASCSGLTTRLTT